MLEAVFQDSFTPTFEEIEAIPALPWQGAPVPATTAGRIVFFAMFRLLGTCFDHGAR
jgi:hypothetical protein